MGAALFEDGRRHVLMAVDGGRLVDYPYGCPTEEGAKFCCYTGLNIFFSIKGITMLPFDELKWVRMENPNARVRNFYSEPIWQS
jgi:hypothetical protein